MQFYQLVGQKWTIYTFKNFQSDYLRPYLDSTRCHWAVCSRFILFTTKRTCFCSQLQFPLHLPWVTAAGASPFKRFPKLSQGPAPTTQSTSRFTASGVMLFRINRTSLSTLHFPCPFTTERRIAAIKIEKHFIMIYKRKLMVIKLFSGGVKIRLPM